MRIAVVGAGHIGGNIARLLAAAGHQVTVSFTRDRAALTDLADQIGAQAADPGEAVASAEVVVLSVPWSAVEEALDQSGSLDGKVVIDTTNPFGAGSQLPAGITSTQLHQQRLPAAKVVKAFNTLTAAFQASSAGRTGPERVVIFLAGDDQDAKATVSQLIDDAGFDPVDVGGSADSTVLEAPRCAGAVYGEEYRRPDAEAVVSAVRAGQPIPPVPHYADAR